MKSRDVLKAFFLTFAAQKYICKRLPNLRGLTMKVLCFGSYDPNYPRNRVIIKGLRENGVEAGECNDLSKIWLRYPNLIRKYKSSDYDAMIVCYLGHHNVPLARILTRLAAKPLIFDAFISQYDTEVFNKKVVKESSLKSKFYFYLDKLACTMSDVILLDTNEHINYFHETFGIEKKKFRRIFVGTDDAIFYPKKKKRRDTFTITFHGGFDPLHGIQYIVKAAKLLEDQRDIKFEILGSGEKYAEIRDLSRKLNVKNITFRGEWVSYEQLPNFIAEGDIGLGIFGDTGKAKRVIPNKVFEILAMRKPLITGDSPAIKEAEIVNRKNALLVEMANPSALARAILELRGNEKLRDNIAKSGYKLFKENFTPKIIGSSLKKVLEEV